MARLPNKGFYPGWTLTVNGQELRLGSTVEFEVAGDGEQKNTMRAAVIGISGVIITLTIRPKDWFIEMVKRFLRRMG